LLVFLDYFFGMIVNNIYKYFFKNNFLFFKEIENLNDEERLIILQIRKQIFEELYILCKNNTTKSEDLSIRYCTIINYFHFYQVKFN